MSQSLMHLSGFDCDLFREYGALGTQIRMIDIVSGSVLDMKVMWLIDMPAIQGYPELEWPARRTGEVATFVKLIYEFHQVCDALASCFGFHWYHLVAMTIPTIVAMTIATIYTSITVMFLTFRMFLWFLLRLWEF